MPRKLTAEEIAKEVRDIETRNWPLNTMLPVKNLYEKKFGTIFRERQAIIPQVVQMGSAGESAGGIAKYPSLEKLVEAGWVVD